MSRTYKELHPTAHNPKNRIPTPYLDKEGKVERRRKRMGRGNLFQKIRGNNDGCGR